MANTVYGIGMKKGLMVIIGDIGVGKTMVAQALLAKSDTEYLKTTYIGNAGVTFTELLQIICQQLGLTTSDNVSEMINMLHQFLLNEDKAERTVALFIDDAHNMPVETLDNLVVLSNLETKDKKLLQIVLLGQPKLETLLNKNELRHIKQRVAIRTTITPLTSEESLSYVQHRLEKAGARDTSAFTKTALKRILKEAKGVPRVINMLCDNSLVTLSAKRNPVTPGARMAITDLMGSKKHNYFRYFRWQTGAWQQRCCALCCLALSTAVISLPNGHKRKPLSRATSKQKASKLLQRYRTESSQTNPPTAETTTRDYPPVKKYRTRH